MHIHFTRSGGFAGIELTTQIDTANLPPDQAQKLEAMVTAAGFFDLPRGTLVPTGADQFQYSLTIQEGGKKHTVITRDADMPQALEPLLDSLIEHARKQRVK